MAEWLGAWAKTLGISASGLPPLPRCSVGGAVGLRPAPYPSSTSLCSALQLPCPLLLQHQYLFPGFSGLINWLTLQSSLFGFNFMLHFLRIWGHFLPTVFRIVTPFSWSLRVYSFCISLLSFKSIWEGDSCGFYHSYFSLKPLIYILRRLVLVLQDWGKNRILQGDPLGDRDISQQGRSRAEPRRLVQMGLAVQGKGRSPPASEHPQSWKAVFTARLMAHCVCILEDVKGTFPEQSWFFVPAFSKLWKL